MRYGTRITAGSRPGSGRRFILKERVLAGLGVLALCGSAWAGEPLLPSHFSRIAIPEARKASFNEHLNEYLNLATPQDVTSLVQSWASGDRALSEMAPAFARQHSRREGIPVVTLHQDPTGNSRVVVGLNGNGHPGVWWNTRF